ncbi:MAG: hypothetical protein ACFB01_14855 [Cohaesibacteraceae bacterium]
MSIVVLKAKAVGGERLLPLPSIVLDLRQNIEQSRNIYLQLRLLSAPSFAGDRPKRMLWRVYFRHFDQPHNLRLTDPNSGTAGPHGKGILMTFDLERYRSHVAPLGLSQAQEDELLRDLWAITETLVDQALTSPANYPQHLAIACSAFDAFEQAVALGSEDYHQPKGQQDKQEEAR